MFALLFDLLLQRWPAGTGGIGCLRTLLRLKDDHPSRGTIKWRSPSCSKAAAAAAAGVVAAATKYEMGQNNRNTHINRRALAAARSPKTCSSSAARAAAVLPKTTHRNWGGTCCITILGSNELGSWKAQRFVVHSVTYHCYRHRTYPG